MRYYVNLGKISISTLIKEIEDTSFREGISVEFYSQVSLIIDIQPEDTLIFIDLLNKYSLLYTQIKED